MVKNKLSIKNLSFYYKKEKPVLSKLSTEIISGEITAVLGINGSGKTTLLKILAGINKQIDGKICYNSHLIDTDNISYYKKILGFMPEFLQMYKDMTVKNVLKLISEIKNYPESRIDYITKMVFLESKLNSEVRSLSKGMKQKLNLAQSIIGFPQILIFDEPSNGFDCDSIYMFYKLLKRISNLGSIIILSSHHLTEVYDNVDKVLILSSGRIIKKIKINDLSKYGENKTIIISYNNEISSDLFFKINSKFKIRIKGNKIMYTSKNNLIIKYIMYLLKMGITICDIEIKSYSLENELL